MIDFTHKKRPEFIQLVLTIAVVCLALGAITPAASAAAYDWEFSVQSPGDNLSGFVYVDANVIHEIPNVFPDGSSLYCQNKHFKSGGWSGGYGASLTDFIENSGIYTDFPYQTQFGYYFLQFWGNFGSDLTPSEVDAKMRLVADFLKNHTDLSIGTYYATYTSGIGVGYNATVLYAPTPSGFRSFSYSYEPAVSSLPFYVDVVDSGNDYLISVSGLDGTLLSGSAYTIAVSTYSGGYVLPLTSYPMYQGDSPVHIWDSDETFTLPVYLSDGVTPIDYYCMLSFPADPTYTGYPFWWNLTVHGSSGYPFDTDYPPVVLPTPTPLIPSDIIPDPNDLNNTVNFTGWYQDQGFEGNNITAPIYSGLRGWFNENMIPVFEFFLMPIGSLSSMISESASTSTNAISDSVEQLSIYAAPMNMVGGYVVLLVPDVVWVVVFAALSIGYVVLLIRISTGSIRDTISRFLGRW